MINLGNMSIADLRLGANQVKAAYFGSKQVWGGEEPVPAGDWLCFTAEEANSQVWFKSGGQTRYFETSTDGQNWSTYTLDTHISLPNVGDKVYFRAATGQTNTKIGNTWQGGTAFAGSGKIAGSGDVKYLISQDGDTSQAAQSCFEGAFKNMTSLVTAPKLGLLVLPNSCYGNAFEGCTNLVEVPEILATTLEYHAFINAFNGCTSLSSVPAVLSATTLAHGCYEGMFYGCTSLTAAPALPATTLTDYCYQNMFNGCTHLSSVEVGLTSWTGGTNPTNNWLNNVAASGTFTCPAELPDIRGVNNIPTGWTVAHPQQEISAVCFTAEEANSTVKLYKYNGGAPTLNIESSTDGSNWSAYTQGTVLTAANVGDKVYFRAGSTGNPTISNTNNTNRFALTGKMAASGDLQYLLSQDGSTQPTADWCFNCLFQYQTGLTEPPKCGATTLGAECYGGTFEGCSNLRYAPELNATNFVGQKVYISMFKGCSSLTTAPATLPATTLTIWCYLGMFYGCRSLTAAPALPATTLADACYYQMFYNCTSLTTAPELPATTLADSCYGDMFNGCTSLSSVEVAFTTWTPNTSINWLRNVAASGTFTCPAELPDTRGSNNIPVGWTVVKPAYEGLRFTAAGSNASVQLVHGNQAPSVSLETSTDGETWTSYSNEVISLPDAGDKVYFRAADVNGAFYASSIMNWEARYANYFDCSNVVVSGKLVSIFRKDMDESRMATPAYLAKNLFRNYNNRQTQIVDASGLEIPDKTYGVMAFQGAFSNSTLSAAPAFPGDTQIYCEQYAWLYENCTKLSSLPGNCLPGSPLTAFSTDGGRTGYGWYERIAGTLPLTSDLSVVVSDAASIPGYVFYNIFDTNSPFTGTFIIDMTSYTSVPTIQSNTFNNDTKPPHGSLEIRVPASLYDTWKNATNWTTWSSYLVPVS